MSPSRPTPPTRLALGRVLIVLTGLGFVAATTGCSDLLDTHKADAVVEIEADDQPAVLQTRQDILAGAASWGGTRVGEDTTTAKESALEFSLPGENLEIALGALGRLDARVVSTTIDVDPDQIERVTPSTNSDGSAIEADADEGQVRLRVEVTETSTAGPGAVFRLVMALFSVVGIVATVMWIVNWWRRRAEHLPPRQPRTRRQVDQSDLLDPPTQENPPVPRHW